MAKIGSQSKREVSTDMTIIAVAKEVIRLQLPTLYQMLEIMPDLSLDKLHEKISKRTVNERSVATASLTVNGRYCFSRDDVEHLGGLDTCLQIMNRKEEDTQIHLGLIRAGIATLLSIKQNSAQHHYPLN